MARKLSMLAPDWWDFSTLDNELLDEAAKLTVKDLCKLSRSGFKIIFYDTLEEFYLAEALEYITSWKQATKSNPVSEFDWWNDPQLANNLNESQGGR